MGGAVGSALGGVTDIFGIDDGEEHRTTKETNKTVTSSNTKLGEQDIASKAAESSNSKEFGNINDALNRYFAQAQGNSQQIDSLFKNALTRYVAGSGNPSPDQLQAATQYVDQTFTAPAQTQYGKFLDQAQGAIANRAAALGRNSMDSAYTGQFANQASLAAQDLSNQRGALIGQRVDQNQQNQLAALQQGSQYFNTPVNQAFANRLNLLNAGTAQQGLGLQRQVASGTTNNTSTQAGSQILPDASLSTKFYNFGSAWGQNDAQVGSIAGSAMKMGG